MCVLLLTSRRVLRIIKQPEKTSHKQQLPRNQAVCLVIDKCCVLLLCWLSLSNAAILLSPRESSNYRPRRRAHSTTGSEIVKRLEENNFFGGLEKKGAVRRPDRHSSTLRQVLYRRLSRHSSSRGVPRFRRAGSITIRYSLVVEDRSVSRRNDGVSSVVEKGRKTLLPIGICIWKRLSDLNDVPTRVKKNRYCRFPLSRCAPAKQGFVLLLYGQKEYRVGCAV